jgi:hypothetical protein
MLDLDKPYEFDWDVGNSIKNLIKHKVTCKEAEEAFFDEDSLLSDDVDHSIAEKRYHFIGKNSSGSVLYVTFTQRKNKIRIISARQADKKERSLYDQK